MKRDPGGDGSSTQDLPRVGTGNEAADRILHGGFPGNSINLIMGQPGTGKTIFVEQLIFHNAEASRPTLYLTTLSEPLSKVVRYLQGFRFFDAAKLGTAVVYDDVGPALARDGVGALEARLRAAIQTMSPGIIVIDSFKAIHDLGAPTPEMRRLVYDITGLLAAYDTTVFLVGEYLEADIAQYAEFAVVDGIVELTQRRTSKQAERYLRVLKLRGSGFEEGAHAFRIGDAGLEIFPRLVSPPAPQTYELPAERVSSGVAELDAMLDGGLWRGSTTLLAGPSGSGKTTLGLQFALAGASLGEPVLYVNFQENPTQLSRTINVLQMGFDASQEDLELLYASPVEFQIDSIVGEIFRRIEKKGIRRLVVDAVGDLAASASDPQRFHDYMYALVQHFTTRSVSTILTVETFAHAFHGQLPHAGPISYMCDNIVLLEMSGEERTRRTLRVVKTRGSAHDARVREIEIGPGGIRVG